MKKLSVCLSFLSMLFILNTALAHGVRAVIFSQKATIVAATYDDGEPMAYAQVEVYSPAAQIVFQTGRTDHNGRFCFFPDVGGHWRVVVKDEMGHQVTLKSIIDEDSDLIASPDQQTGRQTIAEKVPVFSKVQGIIVGISVLFGIFGLIVLFTSRRESEIN